jgi:hypothetical protein
MAELDQRLSGAGRKALGLDSRLGGIQAKQAEIALRSNAETPSTLDQLMRPENLAKLGLATIGAVSGNKDLQALGAGLGLGTLKGAGQSAAEIQAQNLQRIDQLQSMVQKQQQQMVSLLQSQPGLFVDEEGNDLYSPEQWAEILGTGVPLSPSAMIKRRRQYEIDDANLEAGADLLARGTTLQNPAMIRRGLSVLDSTLHWGLSGDQLDNLAYINPQNMLPTLLNSFSGDSVMSALAKADELKAPIYDPRVATLLAPKVDDKVTAGDQEKALLMEAAEAIRLWESQNPDRAQTMPIEDRVAEALSGRTDLQAVYTSKYTTTRGQEIDGQAYVRGLIETMDLAHKIPVMRELSTIATSSNDPQERERAEQRKTELLNEIANDYVIANSILNGQDAAAAAQVGRVQIMDHLSRNAGDLSLIERKHIAASLLQRAIAKAGGGSIDTVDAGALSGVMENLLASDTIDAEIRMYREFKKEGQDNAE